MVDFNCGALATAWSCPYALWINVGETKGSPSIYQRGLGWEVYSLWLVVYIPVIYHSPVQAIAGLDGVGMVSVKTIAVLCANSQHEHVHGPRSRSFRA